MMATLKYAADGRYADYLEPAREMCTRNLRDPIPIAAEQLILPPGTQSQDTSSHNTPRPM